MRIAIEMRKEKLTVWSCTSTAIGVVAELMDMHAAFGRLIVTGDVVGDGSRRGLGGLLEADGAAHLRVTAEDCNCMGDILVVMGNNSRGVEPGRRKKKRLKSLDGEERILG